MGSYQEYGRWPIAVGLAVSLLLHSLLLAVVGQRAPFHSKVYERAPSPLQARVRPLEREELSNRSEQAPVGRALEPPRRRSARKPVADAVKPSPPAASPQTLPSPGDEPSAAPVLDLEAIKKMAREVDRAREPSLSELPLFDPPASDPRAALSRGIAQAARADCRTAHAGKGLLAIPFLIFDAVTDEGCKW
jgi:hypothetical protein